MSNTSISLLDVVLSSREGCIVSSLYREPLSGNTLLYVDSGHPGHVTHGIPVGQFLRVRRICSEGGDFQQEKDRMHCRFLDRCYQPNIANMTIEIAEHTLRERLLRDKEMRVHIYQNSYLFNFIQLGMQ